MPPSSDFALGGSRPNVILFLTDDWPWELWPTVTHGSGGLPNNYSALLPSLSEEFVDNGLHNNTTPVITSPSSL